MCWERGEGLAVTHTLSEMNIELPTTILIVFNKETTLLRNLHG